MFEFLQESLWENDMSYIDRGISTIEDCMYAFECAQTDDDFIVIQESMGSAIESVFERIKDAFKKIIEAFKGLFNKEKNDELAKKIKENPELSKQKVKVPDQKKINKLYDDSVKKIKNGEDPEKVDSWFKKHAKGILLTASISISVGALFLLRERNYKEALSKAEQRGNDIEILYKKAIHENKMTKELLDDKKKEIDRLRDEKTDRYSLADSLQEEIKVKDERIDELYDKNYNLKRELTNVKDKLEEEENKYKNLSKSYKREIDSKFAVEKSKKRFKDKSERMMKKLAIYKSKESKTNLIKESQGLIRITNSFKEFSKNVYMYNGQIITDTIKGPNAYVLINGKSHLT